MEMLAILAGLMFGFGSAATAQDVQLHPHIELSAVPPGYSAPFGAASQYQERFTGAAGIRLAALAWHSDVPGFVHAGVPVSLDWTGTATVGGWDGWAPDNRHQIRATWENRITLAADFFSATWYVQSVEVNAWHHTDAAPADYWRVGVRKEW